MMLLAGITLLGFAAAQGSNDLNWVPFDRSQFSGNVALDDNGDVQLFWKTGDNYSTFGAASRSNGYLALGLSQTGAMTGADMAVGYNDESGNFVLENRYASGFVTPQVSPDQDTNIRLVEGSQSNGVTSFVFEKQNQASCLETQADVHSEAWQWFIYAYSDSNTFAIHAPGHNGKQYVKLGTGDSVSTLDASPMPNTKNLTIVQPEVTVPTDETTYCYSLHKMPEGKGWLVGERPPDASPLLHHQVFYACYDLDDAYLEMLDKQPNCDYQTFSNPCNGFVTEWAPGMSGRTFEPGYGKAFGDDNYQYVMLETHYNNPEHLEGQNDTASYTFLWTDEAVDTEIGTLTLGDLQVEGWFLEPGQPLVKHSTVCTPECTANWPEEGITAVSVFHHMHYRGRNAQVQIIRDGKEIAPLSTLYDFEYGYQFSKSLDSVKLLPGDKLITTCEYDTSNDTEPVPGGLPSEAEMCFAWVDFYPSNTILACTQYTGDGSAEDPTNGTTVALCMDSAEPQPDLYPSEFLTADFEHLPPSGDNCSALGAGSNTTTTSGQAAVLTTCPATDVCFSINIPELSASSSQGDIYFQLTAPSTYSWVALGQGTMMSNANMFVIYSSADGQNVTLSPRSTTGHVMPTHNDAPDVSLMQGSGIVDGRMVANVRCGNCQQWDTGSMDLRASTSDWIYAHLSGDALSSDDVNAAIAQHDRNGAFQWDLTQATGDSGPNPFSAATTNSSSSAESGHNSWTALSTEVQDRMIQAHGVLASLAFVGIFPIGAILMRTISVRHLAWIHGGLQLFGYAIFIAAAGIGIFIADGANYMEDPHVGIGLLLLAVLLAMPFLGAIHHKMYKAVQKRTWWSYSHIFTGRAAILLGIVNGGLGLRLADTESSSRIAYGVIAGVMAVLYIGVIVFGKLKRKGKGSQDAAAGSPGDHELKQRHGADSDSSASR